MLSRGGGWGEPGAIWDIFNTETRKGTSEAGSFRWRFWRRHWRRFEEGQV